MPPREGEARAGGVASLETSEGRRPSMRTAPPPTPPTLQARPTGGGEGENRNLVRNCQEAAGRGSPPSPRERGSRRRRGVESARRRFRDRPTPSCLRRPTLPLKGRVELRGFSRTPYDATRRNEPQRWGRVPSPTCGRRWPDEVGSDEGYRGYNASKIRLFFPDPHPTSLREAAFSRAREKEGAERSPRKARCCRQANRASSRARWAR